MNARLSSPAVTSAIATPLKARGGFEISFEWKNGQVTRLLVDSRVGLPAIIRYNGREVKVPAEKGKTQWN